MSAVFELPGEPPAAAPAPAFDRLLVVEFAPARKPLSLNEALRGTTKGAQLQRAAFIAAWRSSAGRAARAAGLGAIVAGAPAHVWLDVAVDVRRTRDSSNLTLCYKGAVDGLVDAACWPDDDDGHILTSGHGWTKRPGEPHRLIVAPATRYECCHDARAALLAGE